LRNTLKHSAQMYKTLGVLVLNTILMLLVIEGCSALILATRAEPSLPERSESFKQQVLSLSYYQAEAWARGYWDEHMQVADNWSYQPYTIWRTNPFHGQYINVDENGVRLTTGSTCAADSYRIYTFGGSTMWGYGVPDNNTIASYMQAELPENVCVVNYADVGFNSTQSLLHLVGVLQAGDVPDMVIFYDGSNDVTAAQRSGEIGTHFYDEQIRAVVDGTLVEPDARPNSPIVDWVRSTSTYRLLVTPVMTAETWAQPPFEEGFVDGIVQTYLTNVEAAHALSEEYGFQFFAFVQPVLPMVERTYTEEEQRFIWDTPGGLVDLFREVYPHIRDSAPDYVHYFANVLDEQPYIIWIDFNHLTAWGNLSVAADILRVITPAIEQ
jgi:hypothetical protein